MEISVHFISISMHVLETCTKNRVFYACYFCNLSAIFLQIKTQSNYNEAQKAFIYSETGIPVTDLRPYDETLIKIS